MKKILLTLTMAALAAAGQAQADLTGRVVDANGQPIEGAIISATGGATAMTDADGRFTLAVPDMRGTLRATAEDHYTREFALSRAIPATIVLAPADAPRYNGQVVLPTGTLLRGEAPATLETLHRKDMGESPSADLTWQDRLAGLAVVRKSGMPDEGAYYNLRGLHTLHADNTPLIVINGVPFMANTSVSDVIAAYSRDALFGYNAHDIRSITVLKGADAALYGSLASAGVILIETEQATSDNLETRVSYQGNFGVNLAQRAIPAMRSADYRRYLMDIGQTRYSSLLTMQADYPFLRAGEGYYSYLFSDDTDWASEVTHRGLVTDNVFRVEGGDEVAKYNISFGYTREGGTLVGTSTDRYHTAINANIMVSRQFDIFSSVNLAYVNGDLGQTGMNEEVNPLLAAAHAMPLLSPWQKTTDGSLINKYATYDGWNTNADPTFPYDNVSNPYAIVRTASATEKIYDANVRIGLNYRPTPYWTVTGVANIYYDYTEEKLFTPGISDGAIIPQLYGTGKNYASMGVVRQQTYYFNLGAAYRRTFDRVHAVAAYAGARYMDKSYEYDASSGYNTVNDEYRTLTATTDYWNIYGDNDDWRYLSLYAKADYTWDRQLRLGLGLTSDATSVSGTDASRFGFFPSASVTWMAAGSLGLPDAIDRLNISAEGSLTGNSRFSSNYAKNYYQSQNLFNLGTIVRANVPNTRLEWEKKAQADLGIDLGLGGDRLGVRLDAYVGRQYDLLVNSNISAVYGTSENYYSNDGELTSRGLELSLRYSPVRTAGWDWTLYATAATAATEVKSLGGQDEVIVRYDAYGGDDAQTRLRKGRAPYEFYGYETRGVWATTADAVASGLRSSYGNPYQGGDVIFVDQDGNGIINDADRVSLGKATPDVFGSLGTQLRWRQWSLGADLAFALGGKAYNATRRASESMETFYNQSRSVRNRWTVEGQLTDMPRAAYGDPSGNNFFSDRWIEDASFLKLRNVRLTYAFSKRQLRIADGSVWVSADNVVTWSKYLGADPEFAYSFAEALRGFDYAKVPNPITLKVGVNLNF